MTIIKCKMCGGDLEIIEGSSVCECEYCGTKQTVPIADNEKKLTLFARANRLRAANEFDKAAGVYESIVADFPEEAEAYWGLVLCRYGIEYVDDPATGKKIPTCHRSSFDSVLKDSDFDQACENADAVARRQYREEAKQLEDIRRSIIEVSGKEEPYDIFICYKETDENGERTIDSVLAQDVYDALTDKGYQVFFSRVSLEDKLGTEYEPYIFAALNSAKIMLAFGTDYEHYNAVWVKNEWSRFLKLMAKDKSKHLIPCYKNLDPYDIPDEFQRLQAQDLGKVGAVQDLLRGIEKILSPQEKQQKETRAQTIIQAAGPNADSLLRRGEMALEDGNWEGAQDFFNRVLDMTPESAEAYLGLAMASAKCRNRSDYQKAYTQFNSVHRSGSNVKRAKQFAGEDMRKWFSQLDNEAREGDERAKKTTEEKVLASWERAEKISKLIAVTNCEMIGLRSDGTVAYAGVSNRNYSDIFRVSEWNNIVSIAASNIHAVGIKMDGTVVATGNNECGQCDVSSWTDIVSVAANNSDASIGNTFGLKKGGTVVATGNNEYGQCDVNDWNDIVSIAASYDYVVGIKRDGTVVATGNNEYDQCDVSSWTDIVAVAVGDDYTLGLKKDGTVVATGNNEYGQCDVSDWNDIIAVVAGGDCSGSFGLKKDGTVVATGRDVKEWRDICYITSSSDTVGLKTDGTVITTDTKNAFRSKNWKDIVAIDSSFTYSVGIKPDGTVVAFGVIYNWVDGGMVDPSEMVSQWKLFRSLDTLEEEQKEAREKAEREAAEAKAKAEREAEEREAEKEKEYVRLCQEMEKASSAHDLNHLARRFEVMWMRGYKDSDNLARQARQKADVLQRKEYAERERKMVAERAERERKEAAERAERERKEAAERAERERKERRERISTLTAERTSLETELSTLKGLFTGKRRKQIEARLEALSAELEAIQQR